MDATAQQLSYISTSFCYHPSIWIQGQEDQCQTFKLHIANFSTEDESSLREKTSLDTSKKLLNQFGIDGFVSQGEPVLTRFIDPWHHQHNSCLFVCGVDGLGLCHKPPFAFINPIATSNVIPGGKICWTWCRRRSHWPPEGGCQGPHSNCSGHLLLASGW